MDLADVLEALLACPELPYLDRWFGQWCHAHALSVAQQKRLWDGLRRALVGATALPEAAAWDPESGWAGLRPLLPRRKWAAWQPVPEVQRPETAGVPRWLLPQWSERRIRSAWSDDLARRFLAAQATPAPLHVRLAPGSELGRQWTSQGFLGRDGDYVGPPSVLAAGLKTGLVDIQDSASQRTLDGLDLKPGQRVWDACAGQGGKTLLVAEALDNKGVVVATDVADRKLVALRKRVAKAGWQNVRALVWDGEATPDFGVEVRRRGGFDRVVVDAPCSASGTWRRDPEARFRLSPSALAELGRHQERLLGLGWASLRPGGRLAYITCSWLPAENEERIGDFVAKVAARVLEQRLLGLPESDANTMFVAVLEKP